MYVGLTAWTIPSPDVGRKHHHLSSRVNKTLHNLLRTKIKTQLIYVYKHKYNKSLVEDEYGAIVE